MSPFVNRTYYELPITTIIEGREFENFINSWTPEIVIFHSVFNLRYGSFYRMLEKKHIPYLIQLHGALSIENYKKNKFKKRVALLLWIKRFISHAKSIIYLNEAEYKNSIVPKINSKYSILPNGCDTNKNIDICKNVGKELNIIFIGRIAYVHKGLDILMESLKSLEQRNILGYHVTFYGNEDDIDVNHLKNDIASLKSASYGGGLYGESKDRVLREADIFILTSRYEGMPMGVLEAWSYGIPCILTPGTNMVNEALDSDYYWYSNFDKDSIADTIERSVLQYRGDVKKYRKAALEQANKYDWLSIAKLSINIYSKIITRN